jgi:hypothetical protein
MDIHWNAPISGLDSLLGAVSGAVQHHDHVGDPPELVRAGELMVECVQ